MAGPGCESNFPTRRYENTVASYNRRRSRPLPARTEVAATASIRHAGRRGNRIGDRRGTSRCCRGLRCPAARSADGSLDDGRDPTTQPYHQCDRADRERERREWRASVAAGRQGDRAEKICDRDADDGGAIGRGRLGLDAAGGTNRICAAGKFQWKRIDAARIRNRPLRRLWAAQYRSRRAAFDNREYGQDSPQQYFSEARRARSSRADALRDQDRDGRGTRSQSLTRRLTMMRK